MNQTDELVERISKIENGFRHIYSEAENIVSTYTNEERFKSESKKMKKSLTIVTNDPKVTYENQTFTWQLVKTAKKIIYENY